MASLTKLHTTLVHTNRSATHMKVFKNMQKNHGHTTKGTRLDFTVKTCWNSAHTKTVCTAKNQRDLDEAVKNTICTGGTGKGIS